VNLLEAVDLEVRYAHATGLEPTTFALAAGEGVGLIGRNGAGKSTLLRALAGVEPAARGAVTLRGRACHHGHHRLEVGYVPQRALARWDLPVSCREIVSTGLLSRGALVARRDRPERVQRALVSVGAQEYADRPVGHLSGGQAQRVLLARALVAEPDLLLLDEPFTGLDIEATERLVDLLSALLNQGITLVCAMHEVELVRRLLPRTMALLDGRVIEDGPTNEVLSPASLVRLFVPGAA
jgi:ABC-type Mn2+/Zn2+ transport system ATPase subunit